MTASVRTLGTFTIGLAALATIPATPLATPINASAAFDGSAARRCAISTITQCDGTGLWQRHTGSWRPDLPSLLRVNVGQWLITDGQDRGRKTEMTSAARLDGRVLARLIRSVGITAETFRSAKAFLDYPPVDRPACLVLDIRLPGPSGLDVQEALSQAGRDLPIIFITGHGTVPTTVRAMKGGALDFLQKPFNDQELLDCVQRALARSRQRLVERAERTKLQGRLDTLTPREREVLMQVITGKLNKQIASDLGIAEKTIKVHRGRVIQKMQASSVADLVRMVEKLDVS